MRYIAARKWSMLVATTLLAATGIAIFYTATNGWNARDLYPTEISTSTPSIGEQNMSITLAKSQVHHADETNFSNIVLKSNVPVLVDFYADWCGPCKRLAPILEELAAEVPEARIVKINVEDSPSLAAEYGISSIPSLKVFKNGQVSEEIVGLASKSQLRTMLGR